MHNNHLCIKKIVFFFCLLTHLLAEYSNVSELKTILMLICVTKINLKKNVFC